MWHRRDMMDGMPKKRRKGLGYALRLPGPSYVTGTVVALLMVVGGLAAGAPAMALLGLGPAGLAFLIWRTRDTWRENADDWLNRRDGAM